MEEIRGVWITNRPHSQVLTSKANIVQAMEFIQEIGFNVVFPVVWNQGFTLYRSQVMRKRGFPELDSFFKQQGFDPLEVLIQEAHKRQIAVIPWFEYGFACSPQPDGGHILAAKPNWAALIQNGAKVIHGGLTWMNALNPAVQQFMLDLILEVVQKYDVDGIQGDDRFPALPAAGGYDIETKKRFKLEFKQDPPTNINDPQWTQWRADILTKFLSNVRRQVKAVKRDLVVSMAPAVYPFCFNNLLQDSKAWVEKGLVDFIHPQIYRENFTLYSLEVSQIKTNFSKAQQLKFVPGITFKANGKDVSVDDLLKIVDLNRSSSFPGHVFFHYEGLRNNNDAIALALLERGGYDQIASLPQPFLVA